MMYSVCKEYPLGIGDKGFEIITFTITLVSFNNSLYCLSDKQVILKILIPENITPAKGSLREVINELLLG